MHINVIGQVTTMSLFDDFLYLKIISTCRFAKRAIVQPILHYGIGGQWWRHWSAPESALRTITLRRRGNLPRLSGWASWLAWHKLFIRFLAFMTTEFKLIMCAVIGHSRKFLINRRWLQSVLHASRSSIEVEFPTGDHDRELKKSRKRNCTAKCIIALSNWVLISPKLLVAD